MNSYQNLENGVMPIRSTPHSRDSPGSVRQYNRRASRRNLEEELEDTKKTIELQRKEIARLKGELKEEKRTVQHLQVRLSQQQLRMRSNNLGNFVCNVSACGLTFERDDRVREHIRKSEDAEHQRRALYLRERQCPSCGKPCRFYFRHIFTCNKELYRADLADFYGVDLAGEVVSPKEIFSAEFVRRIQSREANASGESGATQIQDIQIDHCVGMVIRVRIIYHFLTIISKTLHFLQVQMSKLLP